MKKTKRKLDDPDDQPTKKLKGEIGHNKKQVTSNGVYDSYRNKKGGSKYNKVQHYKKGPHSQVNSDTAGGGTHGTTDGNKGKRPSKTCMKHKKQDKKRPSDLNGHMQKSGDKPPNVHGKCKKHDMKHKQSIRKRRRKHKLKKDKPSEGKDEVNAMKVEPGLPQNPDDYSMNWRQMLQKMKEEKKGKPTKSKHKHKRKLKEDPEKNKKVQSEPSAPDIWFDDVDELLIKDETTETLKTMTEDNNPLLKQQSYHGLTKVIGMDCEMVGVGPEGRESVLARISLVNHFGHCVYDKFVKPKEKVTDYRTFVSGVRPEDLENGEDLEAVQKDVGQILKGRILVGHDLTNDMKVLYYTHPRKMVRDTARYLRFRELFNYRTPSLKKLTAKALGVEVQSGEHSSVQDAQAAVRLYTMFRTQWEKDIKLKKAYRRSKNKTLVALKTMDIDT